MANLRLVYALLIGLSSPACVRQVYEVESQAYRRASRAAEREERAVHIPAAQRGLERAYLDVRHLEVVATPKWMLDDEDTLAVAGRRHQSDALLGTGVAALVAGAALTVAGVAMMPDLFPCGGISIAWDAPDPEEAARDEACHLSAERDKTLAVGLLVPGLISMAGGTVMVSIGASQPRIGAASEPTPGYGDRGAARVEVGYEGRF